MMNNGMKQKGCFQIAKIHALFPLVFFSFHSFFLPSFLPPSLPFLYLFIYLAALGFSCGMQDILVEACGIQFPDQGSNPGPLHWEHRVLITGSPGKSPLVFIIISVILLFYCGKICIIMQFTIFTIFTILNAQLSGIPYTIVQPSPLSMSRTF